MIKGIQSFLLFLAVRFEFLDRLAEKSFVSSLHASQLVDILQNL